MAAQVLPGFFSRDDESSCSSSVSSSVDYFQVIEVKGLSLFSSSLQSLWHNALRSQVSGKIVDDPLSRRQVQADFPWPYCKNFIDFSSMQYMLFVTKILFFEKCTSLDWITSLDVLKQKIRKCVSDVKITKMIWRLFFNNESSTPFDNLPQGLANFLTQILPDFFVANKKNYEEMFPLKINFVLNDDAMKFLRALFWFVNSLRNFEKKRENGLDILSLLLLDKHKGYVRIFFENFLVSSEVDSKIVRYESLRYERLRDCKRKICDAEPGQFFAIYVHKRSKPEELSFLEEDNLWLGMKRKEVAAKVSRTREELLEFDMVRKTGLNGRSLKNLAAELEKMSRKKAELTEYLDRKIALLNAIENKITRNAERTFILKNFVN